MTKTCARCALELPIEGYAIRSRSPNPEKPQRASWCKVCVIARSKERSAAESAKYPAGALAPKWIGTERHCKTCDAIKPVAEFYAWRGRPNSLCISCQRAYYTKYDADRPGQKTARARVRCAESRRVLSQMKAEKGCEVCGEREPVCLDFHHRDPRTKRFTISKMTGSRALGDLLKEVAQCVVLCANCHRKQHHAERALRLVA